jgi:hypothetical protein
MVMLLSIFCGRVLSSKIWSFPIIKTIKKRVQMNIVMRINFTGSRELFFFKMKMKILPTTIMRVRIIEKTPVDPTVTPMQMTTIDGANSNSIMDKADLTHGAIAFEFISGNQLVCLILKNFID